MALAMFDNPLSLFFQHHAVASVTADLERAWISQFITVDHR